MAGETALSIREEYGVLDPSQVANVITANMGSGGITPFDLDMIHVPNSGQAFEFPALEGSESVKSFKGIIVAWRELRRYYAEAYKPGVKEPPTCSSMDLVHGEGQPEVGQIGGLCATCPHNEWGTGKAPGGGQGRGKACSQYRYLFVQCPGRVLPIVVAVPPSSLGSIHTYMRRLTTISLPYFSVVTEFSLERGDPVPVLQFRMAQRIAADELAQMATYFNEMRRTFTAVDLKTADTSA